MMSDIVYLDNAATSWPKPDPVKDAVAEYFGSAGGNPGRSGHRMSVGAARVVEGTRDSLAELFGIDDPGRIALAKNATEALNIAIYGLVAPGDHVVTSSIEHNSVMRPLRDLEARGALLSVVECGADGQIDPGAVREALRPETRLIVTLHGSNVTGTLLPVAEIASIARGTDVPYLVDASQTAGAVPIDLSLLGIDLLAFTGHKGLLGLTGTGGLVVRDGLEIRPLLRGGTGSRSDLEVHPDFMPDSLEAGTLNVAGLAGLGAGVRFLLDRGVEDVARHERDLVERLLAGLAAIAGVTVYGPDSLDSRCGVVSFNVAGLACSEVGGLLDTRYDVMSRVGLHCAPGAHRTIGTFPQGTVRFGLSPLNTAAEIDHAVAAVGEIAGWAADVA
jgi:cysteine desulfurase/selenocysteine lyase